MTWDFSTEPEFEEKLEWMRGFMRDEVYPLEVLETDDAGFMRAIAKAVGRYNITANNVSLSTIRTPGVANMLNEEAVAKMLKAYVIRRLGEPTQCPAAMLCGTPTGKLWVHLLARCRSRSVASKDADEMARLPSLVGVTR